MSSNAHKLNCLASLNCKNASGDQGSPELMLAWGKTCSCFLVHRVVQGGCNLLLSDHKSRLFPSPPPVWSLTFSLLVSLTQALASITRVPVLKVTHMLSENILRRGPWAGCWCRSTPRLQAGVRPRSVVMSAFLRSCLGRWAGVAVQKSEDGL